MKFFTELGKGSVLTGDGDSPGIIKAIKDVMEPPLTNDMTTILKERVSANLGDLEVDELVRHEKIWFDVSAAIRDQLSWPVMISLHEEMGADVSAAQRYISGV